MKNSPLTQQTTPQSLIPRTTLTTTYTPSQPWQPLSSSLLQPLVDQTSNEKRSPFIAPLCNHRVPTLHKIVSYNTNIKKLLTVVVLRLDQALAQCQCQKQEGARASRQPHSSSYFSSRAADTCERRNRSHKSETRPKSRGNDARSRTTRECRGETSAKVKRRTRMRYEYADVTFRCETNTTNRTPRCITRDWSSPVGAILRANRLRGRTTRMRAAVTRRVWIDGGWKDHDVLRRHPRSL